MNYNNANISNDFDPRDEFAVGVDGEVIGFVAPTAIQNVGSNWDEFGGDDFYSAEGHSNLFGLDAKSRAKRQARKDLREKSKAQARVLKGQSKLQTAGSKRDLAKAQQMAAKASEKGVAGDVALANALAVQAPIEEPKAGMSMGVKIGIGVGIAVVLGVVGFIIYKKVKKGKK